MVKTIIMSFSILKRGYIFLKDTDRLINEWKNINSLEITIRDSDRFVEYETEINDSRTRKDKIQEVRENSMGVFL